MVGRIVTNVRVRGRYVYIELVNPPPCWTLRKRFCALDANGNATNCGPWFDEREGTETVIAVEVNEDTNSETQYQVVERACPESSPAPEPQPEPEGAP